MDPAVQYQEASVLPPLPAFSIDSSPISATDFFLIDPDLSLHRTSEQELIASVAQQQSGAKGEDDLISLYRFYYRFQKKPEAESTAFAIAKLRLERDAESIEWTLSEVHHFATTHVISDFERFGQMAREILKDKRLNAQQYWTLYKEIAAICYASHYPEEAVKLSLIPPELMSECEYAQWRRVHNQILERFPNRRKMRHGTASDSLLWTLFQIQRKRSGMDDTTRVCLFCYFEYHIKDSMNSLIFRLKSVRGNLAAALAVLKGMLDTHLADMLGEMLKDGLPEYTFASLLTFLKDAIAICDRTSTQVRVFEAYLRLYERIRYYERKNYKREEYFLKHALLVEGQPSSYWQLQILMKMSDSYGYWCRGSNEVVLVRILRTMNSIRNLTSIRKLYSR